MSYSVATATLQRSHLLQRLDGGLERRLTLISAAVGSGKTTLLRQWSARRAEPPLWLSLSHQDNAPRNFVSSLAGSFAHLDPELAKQLLSLTAEQALMSTLNLLARSRRKTLLILDDYHRLTNPTLQAAFAAWVDYLPPTAHLFIGTRRQPPLPLARMRVRGQLQELRTADLACSLEESRALLRSTASPIHTMALEALHARTEGWISGLVEGVGQSPNIQEGCPPAIAALFEREVLAPQPPSLRTFIRQTASLPHLSAEACDALTGRQDGQRMLEELERRNLFVVPLDEERREYRYHRLFALFLRSPTRTLSDIL